MEYKDFKDAGITTDKITHHGYHRIYPWFLSHLEHKNNVRVLEIGAHEMGSVKLWKKYFNSVDITVIDIDQKAMDGVRCIKLDQSNRGLLEIFASENLGYFDLIIDDGSHVPEHQLITIDSLWKTLKPMGIYIIEDIETSYWGNSEIYGYKFNANRVSIINEFKFGLDLLNSEFYSNKHTNKSLLNKTILDSEMITFAYNCVIIVKKSDEFEHFYHRKYKFKAKINEFNLISELHTKILKCLNSGIKYFKKRFGFTFLKTWVKRKLGYKY